MGEVTSKEMGIKLWLAPQISLHWPKNLPKMVGLKKIKFRRPGQASTLTDMAGSAQECRTSPELTINRKYCFPGTTILLSTSKSRKSPQPNVSVGAIKLSNSTSGKSKKSYDQYHWCPVTLTEISLEKSTLWQYSIEILGTPMNKRITAGKIVQTNSREEFS